MYLYWINIDAAVDRRKYMTAQLDNPVLGIQHERVSATTPDTLPNLKRALLPASKGVYACTHSHLRALRKGLQRGDSWFLVSEDDIEFTSTVDWDALLESLPADAELAQLHISNPRVFEHYFAEQAKRGIWWCAWRPEHYSTGLYLISRAAAQRILLNYPLGVLFDFSGRTCASADFVMYHMAGTYSVTYPICLTKEGFGSFHPDHLPLHEAGRRAAEQLLADVDKPPSFVKR